MSKINIKMGIKYVFVPVLMSVAVQLYAEEIYRYTDEEGRIIYSDSSPEGAKDIKTVPVPPPPDEKEIKKAKQRHQQLMQKLNKEEQHKTRTERLREGRIKDQVMLRKQLQREFDEARSELEQAEKALEQGQEPLPGERQGTVSGYSRFRPEYFKRISKLEDAVEKARMEVDQAERNLRTMSREKK